MDTPQEWRRIEKEKSGRVCAYLGCEEPPIASCDCCRDAISFCEDHGSPSRDVYDPGYAPHAVPACCWKCGGYNADEE